MKVEMPAEKASEIEECAAKIAELLQAAKALDEAVIPDSVKNQSVFELEGSPVRIKNVLCNMGVCTLWELSHFDMTKCMAYRAFRSSKHMITELMYAISEAIDRLCAAQGMAQGSV